MVPDSLLSGEGLWLRGRLQTADRLRAKAGRNIHLTRGNKAFTPFLRSRKERKDMRQIVVWTGLLFVYERKAAGNTAPFCLKWALCQPRCRWHHVNGLCPDRIWTGGRRAASWLVFMAWRWRENGWSSVGPFAGRWSSFGEIVVNFCLRVVQVIVKVWFQAKEGIFLILNNCNLEIFGILLLRQKMF